MEFDTLIVFGEVHVRRLLQIFATVALLGAASSLGHAQDQGTVPPPPTDRRPRLGDTQEPAPAAAADDAPRASDGGAALERRRPVLSLAVARGRDITIEMDLGGLRSEVLGDAHAGEQWEYQDLYEAGTFLETRVALPLRFFGKGTVSLWAGPLVDFQAGSVAGRNASRGVNDVVVVDDWQMSRLVFGGLFRAEFGRWFVELWGGIGVGHAGRGEAQLDQTASGGGLSPFVLYKHSTLGVAAGAMRFGVVWQLGERFTLSLWGTGGVWASGAPEEGGLGPLTGPVGADPMSGVFVGIGLTLGFSLGDFQTKRAAEAEAGARPAPSGLIR